MNKAFRAYRSENEEGKRSIDPAKNLKAVEQRRECSFLEQALGLLEQAEA